MMLSLLKKLDDYETMHEIYIDYKNGLLEITLVEKMCRITEIHYQDIFDKIAVDREIFLNKLDLNEINIE